MTNAGKVAMALN